MKIVRAAVPFLLGLTLLVPGVGRAAYASFHGAAGQDAPKTPPADDNKVGADSYSEHCQMCHGKTREGMPPTFPTLVGIKKKMTDAQITEQIQKGKGRMPAFPDIEGDELAGLLRFLGTDEMTPAPPPPPPPPPATPPAPSAANAATKATLDVAQLHAAPTGVGSELFQKDCSFCHGRDAAGGESGPDLTRSKLVTDDKDGDKISIVVSQGRPGKMPAFSLSSDEMASVVTFVHTQQVKAIALGKKGGRRGVEVADLQTGNADEGRAYFNGAGTCSTCHSATGDLAGVATRYQGLRLEQRMLYPRDVPSRVQVMAGSGPPLTGVLEYQDEFTLGMRDGEGIWHSWPIRQIKYTVSAPVEAHAALFARYTDKDIHNLMAYVQTLN